MTSVEYRETIHRLGFTQVGAAEFLCVNPTTCRRWIADKHPVPDVVAMTLRLMLRYQLTRAQVERVMR